MNQIDESIGKARVKNRWLVGLGSAFGIAVVGSYLIWLFLIKGYQITLKPEEITLSGRIQLVQGLGWVSGNKVYSFGGVVTLQVSAEKYVSQEVIIDNLSFSNIEVTLQPQPAIVTLTTEPTSDETQWFVNHKAKGKFATFQSEFVPEKYSIQIKNPYFESTEVALTLEPAQTLTQQIPLVAIEGSIAIQTVPKGASVVIGGGNAISPVTKMVKGGAYPVSVSLTGYQSIEDVVEVTESAPNPRRNYRLQPLQGTLKIHHRPTTGILLLNGLPIGTEQKVVANQPHELSFEAPGYQGWKQTVDVAAGQTEQISIELEPELGVVEFVANEPVDVVLDGKNLGQTPLSVKLQTLPKTVQFKQTGYRTVSRTFTPNAREVQRVKVDLISEFDARRKEGRPLFANQIGIELIGVRPKSFKIGSPINESDRFRNEHQRQVAFSRDVWISKHEITEAQYHEYSKKGPSSQLPVTNIRWQEAALFTNWLSEQEGLVPFYIVRSGSIVGMREKSKGYRLVTEAEWEFIAKLNKRSALTQFVWGSQERIRDKQGNFADDTLKDQQTFYLANYEDGFIGKAPVGSFKAERGGFFDLDGNVREWTHDFYNLTLPDDGQIYQNYLGPSRGEGHVVKGASYKTGRLKNIRASRREGFTEQGDDIGFRIARYHN